MDLAYHLVFSAYGFWLPNDPRGSWSTFVGSPELYRFGPATKASERRSLAAVEHDHALRLRAKESLKFSPVAFTGRQALAVAQGMDTARQEAAYQIYACAIMPDHVHVVVARHERNVDRIIGHFKAKATIRLADSGLWPNADRTVWAKKGWHVFLNSSAEGKWAIEYVARNPSKDGKRPQFWSFLEPFEGRGPLEGYARRDKRGG